MTCNIHMATVYVAPSIYIIHMHMETITVTCAEILLKTNTIYSKPV